MNGNAAKTQPIVLWIIHFAFMTSIPIYAMITTLFLAPPQAKDASPGGDPMFLAVLAGVAVMTIILALTADHWMKLGSTNYKTPEGTAAGYMERAIVKTVIIDSLYESIAIYGLVGVFMGFKLWWSYVFMAVALLALLIRIATLRDVTDTYYQLKRSEELG